MHPFSPPSALAFLLPALLAAQESPPEKVSLNPNRPTFSNSSGIQSKGIVQIEIGYDAYPSAIPQAQHTLGTSLFYTPASRVRVDLGWSAFAAIHAPDAPPAHGIGTLTLGSKVLIHRDLEHHRLPGLALQYEAELPTASDDALTNRGAQTILLLNKHIGPLNLVLNGSLVQTNCQSPQGCALGGQQAAAFSFHPRPPTTLYAELAAQNVPQTNAPPGTYLFGGFLHRFSDTFGIDGGLRFGLGHNSPRIGTSIGLVFGNRIHNHRN